MSFDSKCPKAAFKKSKRKSLKNDLPIVKEKMDYFNEKLLNDLLAKQDKVTKTYRANLLVSLWGYIFPEKKTYSRKVYTRATKRN